MLIAAAKAFFLWLLLALLAMANGVVRERVLIPAWGNRIGLRVSGLTLSAIIFFIAWFTLPWFGPASSSWLIGSIWLVMTLVFEFGFGRFVARKSWADLIDGYNLRKGNLWLLVLATTLLSPWLAAKLRG